MKTIVSPSLLAADHAHIKEEIELASKCGAKWIHYDIMDNIFVPNTSFSSEFVKETKPYHSMVCDVHIMIINPKENAFKFIEAGADYLTFHYEACKDEQYLMETIKLIRENNCKVGLSIKPNTSVETILPFIKYLDMVLIMSVEPGFGGQKYLESATKKIEVLRSYIDENKFKCLIEVDGGINDETYPIVKKAGVDVIVAGSYLFGKPNMDIKIKEMEK